MSITQPLDIYDLVVNTVSGSIEVFTFLCLMLISVLCARLRMPQPIFLMFIALFGIFMSAYLKGIYTLIILLVGIIVFSAMYRAFE